MKQLMDFKQFWVLCTSVRWIASPVTIVVSCGELRSVVRSSSSKNKFNRYRFSLTIGEKVFLYLP